MVQRNSLTWIRKTVNNAIRFFPLLTLGYTLSHARAVSFSDAANTGSFFYYLTEHATSVALKPYIGRYVLASAVFITYKKESSLMLCT